MLIALILFAIVSQCFASDARNYTITNDYTHDQLSEAEARDIYRLQYIRWIHVCDEGVTKYKPNYKVSMKIPAYDSGVRVFTNNTHLCKFRN